MEKQQGLPKEIAREAKPVARQYFAGTSFDGGKLPIRAMLSLRAYETLLAATARELMREARGSSRLPRHTKKQLELHIESRSIKDGSANILLFQNSEHAQQGELFESLLAAAEARVRGWIEALARDMAATREIPIGLQALLLSITRGLRKGERTGSGDPSNLTAPSDTISISRIKQLKGFLGSEAETFTHLEGTAKVGNSEERTINLRVGDFPKLRIQLTPGQYEIAKRACEGQKFALFRLDGKVRYRLLRGHYHVTADDNCTVSVTSTLQIDPAEGSRGERLAELRQLIASEDEELECRPASRVSILAEDLLSEIGAFSIPAPAIYVRNSGAYAMEWKTSEGSMSVEFGPTNHNAFSIRLWHAKDDHPSTLTLTTKYPSDLRDVARQIGERLAGIAQ